jgi:diacylglycerol kinase (ATP)
MAIQKFIFVVNPVAGNRDKFDVVQQVHAFAKSRQVALIDFQTRGRHDEEALLEAYIKHLPDRILVAGGDGTIHLVTQALHFYKPTIAIIPQGSANGLAVDCGIPENLEAALEVAFNGAFLAVDLLKINGSVCVHLSDIGLNASLIKNYQKGLIRGKLGYVIQAFNTSLDEGLPFHVAVTTAEKNIESKAVVVIIANSKKYGTGVTINPIGVINDGKFEIIVLKDLNFIVLGKIMTGNFPFNSEELFVISTKRAIITSNRMVDFQLDGEYLGQVNQLEIEMLPQQITLVVPNF